MFLHKQFLNYFFVVFMFAFIPSVVFSSPSGGAWTPTPQAKWATPTPTVTPTPTPTQSWNKPTPTQSWNKPTPTQSWNKPTPTQSWNKPVPTQSWSKPVPTQSWSKPIPTQSWSKPIPTQSWSKPIPTQSWSKPIPTQSWNKPTPTKGNQAQSIKIVMVDAVNEFITLKNFSTVAVVIDGWYLISESGYQRCNLHRQIPANESFTVRTQAGQGGDINCGYNGPILNNVSSDPTSLYNANGELVDRKE